MGVVAEVVGRRQSYWEKPENLLKQEEPSGCAGGLLRSAKVLIAELTLE